MEFKDRTQAPKQPDKKEQTNIEETQKRKEKKPTTGTKEKTYESRVAEAKEAIKQSFLREILYTTDEDNNLIENSTVTDISFNGSDMYVQDNEIGRYKVDSEKDPRIKAGLKPLMVTVKDVETLGNKVQNVMSNTWNNTNPIMDSELGELRTNFMHKTVSPYGVTFALRVSRPRLAITDVAELCDEETAQLLEVFMRCDFNLLISGQTGSGKALTNTTKIPTVNGWKSMGDLKVGDIVFDRFGKPTTITGVFPQGKLDVYKLMLEDGREILCNDEHIWSVFKETNTLKNVTVRDMLDFGLNSPENKLNFHIPMNNAVEYPKAELKNSPYDLGIELKNTTGGISKEYLISSISQRMELLQGLLDSNGEIINDEIIYKTNNSKLAKDIQELGYSLGIQTIIDEEIVVFNVPEELIPYIFTDSIKKELALHLQNKKDISKIGIISIVKQELKEEMTCILVDNEEHLFLADLFMVTHNTEFQKALIGYIPQHKKISLMEDTLDSHIKELYPDKDINSWATSGEIGSENYIGFPELIRAGLRNNPDWLMISEVRGAEASSLLAAALTGHSIMTTIHATGADTIPSRLSNMVAMAGGVDNFEALQLNIVSVLNLGIHLTRIDDLETGKISRVIREMYEYVGYKQGQGIMGYPIYERVQVYDEETDTYSTKINKNRLSERLLDKIKNNKELHRVPDVYKTGNPYEA